MAITLRRSLNHLKVISVCLTLIACADTKQPNFTNPMSVVGSGQPSTPQGQIPTSITGSIVDGPVDNRTITVRNASGQTKKILTEDGQGGFRLASVFSQADYPLIFTAEDEAQLLVMGDPGFTLMSTSPRSAIVQQVSINAYSTLITKVALKLPGGITVDNLDTARDHVVSQLNFGLYGAFKDNPTKTLTTENNIHVITKASEALSEMIRRTSKQLNINGHHMTTDAVVDAIAADLVNGKLDGIGPVGTDPNVSAIAHLMSGQVALEAITNELQVRSTNVAPSLDYVITSTYPESSYRTKNVHLTEELISQAKMAVQIANSVLPSDELTDIMAGLEQLTPFMRPDRARKILPGNMSHSFEIVSRQVAKSGNEGARKVNVMAVANG